MTYVKSFLRIVRPLLWRKLPYYRDFFTFEPEIKEVRAIHPEPVRDHEFNRIGTVTNLLFPEGIQRNNKLFIKSDRSLKFSHANKYIAP
jgi:hypothetical protein